MKALPIYVYRNGNQDTTLNGISNQFDQLLLVCKDGFIDIDENNLPKNLVKVVTRNLGDRIYKHIEPYQVDSKKWKMAGGNFAFTSDSRFTEINKYPLSIHDRFEEYPQ